MRFVLTFVTLFVFAVPVTAQTETYTWSPYDFTLTLPVGWTAAPDDERLLLGTPDDVGLVADGELSDGPVVVVQIIEQQRSPEYTVLDYVPFIRDIDPVQVNAQIMYVDIPPIADRQSRVIYVAPNYLLTASASTAQWGEFVALLDALVASIEAAPIERTPAETLTQDFRWRGLSLTLPDNFLWYAIPGKQGYHATTEENRQQTATAFRVQSLWIDVIRFDHLRAMLSPESLPFLNGHWYRPDRMTFGKVTLSDVNGTPAAIVDFANEDEAGRAVLLLTEDDAYLIAGLASAEQWSASEAALFEAILATVRLE